MNGALHTHFSRETLNALTEQLIERRDALTRSIASLSDEIEDAVEHRDRSDLLDEEALDDADVAAPSLLVEQARHSLVAVEHALSRMAEGTYGYCVWCGEPIPLLRLRALPASRACIACVRRHDLDADEELVHFVTHHRVW